MMDKRFREENTCIIINGFGYHVKGDEIFSMFSQFGKICELKFLGRRQCLIRYEEFESSLRALQLHNTRQPGLSAPFLAVTMPTGEKTIKKMRLYPGHFVIVKNPRFSNFLIPVLPAFFSN